MITLNNFDQQLAELRDKLLSLPTVVNWPSPAHVDAAADIDFRGTSC
jgi:hypothetical protein